MKQVLIVHICRFHVGNLRLSHTYSVLWLTWLLDLHPIVLLSTLQAATHQTPTPPATLSLTTAEGFPCPVDMQGQAHQPLTCIFLPLVFSVSGKDSHWNLELILQQLKRETQQVVVNRVTRFLCLLFLCLCLCFKSSSALMAKSMALLKLCQCPQQSAQQGPSSTQPSQAQGGGVPMEAKKLAKPLFP